MKYCDHSKGIDNCPMCGDLPPAIRDEQPGDGNRKVHALVGSLFRDVETTGREIIIKLLEFSDSSIFEIKAWDVQNFAKAAIAELERSNSVIYGKSKSY